MCANHPLVTHPRFPIIAGPTASGKTALSIALARTVGDSEIVSADAFQVYRGMDIGTGKATPEERALVPHHLIDVAQPSEPFSVSRWLQLAEEAITAIRARGRIPIVVGGTHLYVKSLLDGMFEGPGRDEALRAELEAMDAEALRAELARVDPQAAARIHPSDRRRSVRAIEVFRLTGQPISTHQTQWDQASRDDRFVVTLNWSTETLNRRINARVRQMMEEGLLGEVTRLHERGEFGETAREGLGYKQLLAHIEGRSSLDDAVEKIKIETRRFAKNQRTWIRRLGASPGALRLEPETDSIPEMCGKIAQRLNART